MKRAAALACLLAASSAQADPPPLATLRRTRQGVAFDASLGLGVMTFRGYTEQTKLGPSGLNLGYGVWLRDATALVLRLGALTVAPDNPQAAPIFLTSLTVTVGAQHFVTGPFFIGGGVGIGKTLDAYHTRFNPGTALAFDLRAGIAFLRSERGAWFVAASVAPTQYEESLLVSVALQVGWQLY